MVWRPVTVAYAIAVVVFIVAARSIDGPGVMLASLAVVALTLPWSSAIVAYFSWTLGHNGAGDFWLPLALAGLLNVYLIATANDLLRKFTEERRVTNSLGVAFWRAAMRECIARRRVLIAILVLGIASLVPIERTLFPAWSVTVLNTQNQPVEGVRVGREWTHRNSRQAVNFFAQDPDNIRLTNSAGTVVFPPVSRTLPVGWWIFAYSNWIGDSGYLPAVSGSVTVLRVDGTTNGDPPLLGPSSCEDEACLNRALETTFLVSHGR